ncbi:MAG: hypothetical protein J6B02_01660 [Selenomonadales bacterium]|nr:hypothetical protein [Selenomonadales bacterium]
MLKKAVRFLLLAVLCLFPVTMQAAPLSVAPGETITVILDAPSDFSIPRYYDELNTEFKRNFPTANIVVGSKAQDTYYTYWMNRGYLEPQKMTQTQELFDLAAYCKTDKLIVLLVTDSIMDDDSDEYRANISMRAFAVTPNNILAHAQSTRDDHSRASNLRAKKGAFDAALDDIMLAIAPPKEKR